MKHRPVAFFSERSLLDGDLYLPDGLTPGERRPALVIASGYTGLKDIHPARFSRALVPQGFVCLSFDYRGFGHSEGERGRLVPQDQVRDVHAAVSFLSSCDEVDAGRVGLIGWALGGGVVVATAADDDRVTAVAALNAVGDGRRTTRHTHTEDSWDRLLARIEADRVHRARTGRSEIVDPFEILPLDEVTAVYVDDQLYPVPGFGTGVTLESAERLLGFRPELVVDRVAPRPLLLIHGEDNDLYPPGESRRLREAAGGHGELVLLEDRGHTEWMRDDDPTFQQVVDELAVFFSQAFDGG